MPTPSKNVKSPGRAADDTEQETEASVVLNISISEINWRRLNIMRKKKGQKKEQELIRVFISEGLDRSGF